jgi:hypothetical protein
MVTVETKNYPVTTIRPSIQRYAKIRKRLNATEIANCLAVYANVTLEKNDGTKIKLTKDNFKGILYDYTNQLKKAEFNKKVVVEEKKNDERIQNIIDNPPVVEEQSTVEEATNSETIVEEETNEEQIETTEQTDPELNGEFDDSEYYDDIEED